MNARLSARFLGRRGKIFAQQLKTDVGSLAYLLKASSQEIVMFSAATNRSARIAGAVSGIAVMSWVSAAMASQGPGGGMGTASNFIQVAMAALVYGLSALVVGAGLIGALRKHQA
jgi:hypothetical protein